MAAARPLERWRPVFASVFVPMQNVDSSNILLGRRNQGSQTLAQQAAAAYYECLVVLFASARRWHPEARLLLFTPAEVPSWFRQRAHSLDLELVAQPFRHVPPDADSGRFFVSSLYTLDAIDWIATQGSQDEVFLLLDADTVLLGPLDPARWAQRLGYLGWAMKPGYDFHGLPFSSYWELVSKSGLPDPAEPQVVGGEFLAGSTAVFRLLAREAARVEQLNVSKGPGSKLPLTSEEHVLSLAVPYLQRDNSLSVVNRIWTTAHHRTVDGREDELLIWHLPGEKGRGFHKAVDAAADNRSWLWRAPRPRYLGKMGRIMGVTGRSTYRRAEDWTWSARGRLRNGKRAQDPVVYGPPW